MIMSFAQPKHMRRIAEVGAPLCAVLSLPLLILGLYFALAASPADYQQGETVRIMYVHVPAAWGALMLYVGMALAAISAFIWKHKVADMFIDAAVPIGTGLAALCLITGSLWGKPMWGAWWVWDARLTSMLVLFLLYAGVMILRGSFASPERGAKASHILLVLGLINIPIIKFSVDWWNTLHQGESIFKKTGPTIDPAMMQPLFLMAFGLFFFCAAVILARLAASFGQKA